MFVDPLAEETMTPYHYVHNNPIMMTDPTGMSAEDPEGGGFWSRAKSFLRIGSTNKQETSPIEDTILDEVVISTDRKPNWITRNFSKDKLSNDWKNIKENTGWNHGVKELVKTYKSIQKLGGYKIWGGGSEDRGNFKSHRNAKSINTSDMANVGAGGADLTSKLLFFLVADGVQMFNSAFSGGVSIKDDENVKNGVETIKRTLYRGINDSLPININPQQNKKLEEQSQGGERFRDSLRNQFDFNSYK